jgi:hypothetical protein
MRRAACTAFLLLVAGPSALPQDHLVASDRSQAAVEARAAERARDLAVLDRVLSTATAVRTAAQAGTDVSSLKAALPALSDAELSDLAHRASTLSKDPRAGLTHDVEELLIIFLVVALVILLIKAA